jgi:hypothetical protein
VGGTFVAALAVDHHRAGEHEPAHTGGRHRGQQHGGAEVVAGHVLRQVLKVDAHSDHGGLMDDRVDADQCGIDGVPVADVSDDEAGFLAASGCVGVAVRGRVQAVQRDDLMPRFDERGDDLSPDEARTARNQYPHMAHGKGVRSRPDHDVSGW